MRKFLFIVPIFIFIGLVIYMVSDQESERYLPNTLQVADDFMYANQLDSALLYAKKVVANAKNSNNIAYAECIIGYVWYHKGFLDSAYNHYTLSLEASYQSDSTDYYLQTNILRSLGSVFEKYEMHKKAISYFERAAELYEPFEKPAIAKIYYDLAFNQSQINDIECVKSYYKALEYATKYENKYYEAICLNDLGNLMLDTENFESAVEYFTAALNSDYVQQNNDLRSFALQGLGEAYFYSNQLDLSESNLNQALALKEGLEDKKYLFTSYLFLARLKQKKGDLTGSEKSYIEALEVFAVADHTRENINVFKEIGSVQLEMGKIKASNENKVRHYAEIEKYLDEREKAAEIARKDQFDTTVAVTEAQYRNNNRWTLLDQLDWEILIKSGALLYLLFFIYIAERKFQNVRLVLVGTIPS